MEIQNVPLPDSCADLDNCCKVEGGARDDFVFQSGPRSVSEIKQCEFIKFEFSKEGGDS